MVRLVARTRQHLLPALVVASFAQVLLTVGGSVLPERSDLYGAPFPVGESGGLNVLFTAGYGSFFFSVWVLNVLVTAVVLSAGSIPFKGRTTAGLVATSLALVVAYGTVLVLPGSQNRSNQLAIWVWMLVVVTGVWGISRFMRPQNERGKV